MDVLIVGSGPVGCTYARRIRDASHGTTVLMVELGAAPAGRRGQHLRNLRDPRILFESLERTMRVADPTPPAGDGDLRLPGAATVSGVGGMGVYWGTSSPRPRQSERVPFIPGEELDAALDDAERLLGVAPPIDEPGLLRRIRTAMAEEFDGPGLEPVGLMPTATRREGNRLVFSGTEGILGTGAWAAFELRTETLARRILVEDGAAVGAELRDRRTGETYEVRADHIVVCADGLRTPQLLHASGVRPRALGHHLNDHLRMPARVSLSDEFDPARFPIRSGHLDSVHIPYSDARPIQGEVMPSAGLATGPPPGHTDRDVGLLWYGAKDIQFGDAVEFSDTEHDDEGMPRMSLHYSHTAADLRTIEKMRECAGRAGRRLGRVVEEPELQAGGASLHYQGAVRMGATDDGDSVCDPYLRVWGVRDLYLGGNGVIPTSTAANPTLTSVALAWRAAGRLVESLTRTGTR